MVTDSVHQMPLVNAASEENTEAENATKIAPGDFVENLAAKKIAAEREIVLEKITSPGRYQLLLLILVWWANITIVGNVVFMVFGGASDKTYNSPECQGNSKISENCKNGTLWTFYSFFPEWSMEEKPWLPTLMTSVQLFGAFIGAALGGQLADWYGRKLNTWIWLAVTITLGPLSAFSPSWQIMTVFRFMIGISTAGYDASTIILVMEWVNSKSRLPVQSSSDCAFSLGFIWFSLLAYLCQNWRILSVVCCLQGIPCLIGFWFVDEPPIWLLLKGKTEKAAGIVKKVGSWNKTTVKLTCFNTDPTWNSLSWRPGKNTKRSNYCDLFRTPRLAQYSCMLIFSFLVMGTTGYMLIFNAGNLLGNIFLNFGLLGIVNTVSACLTIIANQVFKLRRRQLHQICLNGLWISFAVVIVIYCLNVEENMSGLLVTCAMMGSMFSFPLWVLCNLYSGELYPTNIRNMGSGIGSMAARFGGIIAPQIVLLFEYWKPLPFIVTATAALVNAVLAFFFLPETRGKLQEAPNGILVISKIFKEADKDEDGKVDYDEVAAFVPTPDTD